MQFSLKRHHVALAIAAFVGLSSVAQADDTTSTHQDRAGLMLNIPFDSHGFVFKDSVLSLVFQSAHVKSNAYGWQLAFGSKLNAFSPVFAVSALGGDRCGYATVGVSYGAGQWGVPVSLTGPYVQVGLSNVGGFGGFQAGLNTFGCFKRYTPPSVAASSSSSGSSSSSSGASAAGSASSGSNSSSGSFSMGAARNVDSWLQAAPNSNDFDWA
jgi:hypothetical protein